MEKKAKPNANPMRMALGATGIAAVSALAAAIVLPPQIVTSAPDTQPQYDPTADPTAGATTIQLVRPIVYVQLSPGQSAPPGAQVIAPAAPTPHTVVVSVPAPVVQTPAKAPAKTPAPVKTKQSGKVP